MSGNLITKVVAGAGFVGAGGAVGDAAGAGAAVVAGAGLAVGDGAGAGAGWEQATATGSTAMISTNKAPAMNKITFPLFIYSSLLTLIASTAINYRS
jgi:hypothetical protein